ncbi:MAG: tripartite tricarboxylate transporter substrate binding protein, partial [Xanthobacteraceae bacterium]
MFDIDRRNFALLGVAAALAPLRAAAADTYPSRPLHLLVGFTPGSSSDITGRIFAHGADAALGQDVAVENKPGAGGAIAAG